MSREGQVWILEEHDVDESIAPPQFVSLCLITHMKRNFWLGIVLDDRDPSEVGREVNLDTESRFVISEEGNDDCRYRWWRLM